MCICKRKTERESVCVCVFVCLCVCVCVRERERGSQNVVNYEPGSLCERHTNKTSLSEFAKRRKKEKLNLFYRIGVLF